MVVGPRILCLVCTVVLSLGAGLEAFIISPGSEPWQRTASGRRSGNGVAGTLTWSIVPDGTNVDDGDEDFGGSDLIDFLNENFDGDSLETDHREQPWFSIFEDSVNRWAEISGLNFVYEPNDDGGNHDDRLGILGTRGDIRFAGASIDGRNGVLAFNFFPEFGGDMAIDTDETGFARSSNNFRFFRSTIMHELGHAFGLDHVRSNTDALLMDAFADSSIDGPQLDEVRGVQFYFGDAFEASNDGDGNETAALATDLGPLFAGGSVVIGADADVPTQAIPTDATDFVSISHGNDVDYYSFEVSRPGMLSASLTPLGGEFTQAGEGEANPTAFDANARSDLSLRLLDTNGRSTLVFADETVEGQAESLEAELLSPGTYYAKIEGLADTIQLYMLDLELTSLDILGDCNGDGVVDRADVDCACSADLATVLIELDSLVGDFDLNGKVDFADFLVLSQSFGEEGDFVDGDLDCSGHVDFADFLSFARAFADTTASGNAAATVPEPNGLLALNATFLAMFWRRRRRLNLP